MGRIIGIDLGTTTSEIAYINNGKPEIIVDVNNNRIIPSAVHLNDDGEIIIGDYAKRMKLVKPERTVMEIKRKMGQNVSVKLENDYYKPYEISSMILKKLKEYAELYLGEEVTEAVITVPANFNDLQRNATKRAGELAGLKVERIINEPTAAALAYGINNLDDVGKVLVYDLGGGTFDVSVLDFDSGILDVLASRGINCLGGKDFDNLIADYILNDFYNKYGINLKNDLKCMSRITEAAENAKIELSSVLSTEIFLPFLAIDSNQKPIDYSLKLTRSEFENMIYDLLNSTIYKVSEALEAAKLNDKDIDIVLAVGGSSRIPLVKNLLVKRFGNKIKTKINPDEAVALGAAIQAGIKNDEISPEDGIIITYACYYNLGIKVATEVGNGRIVEEIFEEIISLLHCYSMKLYSKRKGQKIKKILEEKEVNEEDES
jgi:molecular chaperone DnaK